MTNETLKLLNFNDKEIEVYLTVLKYGKVVPSIIAKVTGISRPTVYSVAKNLIRKGVITEDLSQKTSYLLAKPLSDLHDILDKEKQELKQKENLIKIAINELSPIVSGAKYSVPKIKFIDQDNLEDYLYKQAPAWNESVKSVDGIWWGFQDNTFVERFGSWIDYVWEEISPDGHVKLLTNKSNIEKSIEHKYSGREIKFWDKSSNFTATTWVVGEYLIMIVTNQKPYYLVEIKDAVLSHNMREVFKNIWNVI